jgi:TolB-like protein
MPSKFSRGPRPGVVLVFLTCLAWAPTAVAQGVPSPRNGGATHLVAVAPFQNISGQPADRWIGAGIAESVAGDLDRLEGVSVVGRDALTLPPPSEIASSVDRRVLERSRERGATWLVTGGYQRVGEQLRITARIVDVDSGVVSGRVALDADLRDLFALQDEIVTRLIGVTGAGLERLDHALAAQAPSSSRRPAVADDAGNGGRSETARTASGLAVFSTPGEIDGPPAPTLPEVMSRDEQGGATLRAVRVSEPVRLDGRLAEAVYQEVQAITGFIQQVPDEGAAATEKTEAWILFDDENIYVGGRVWDSAPPSEWVANEMRRDANQLRQNDNFVVLFGTFYDRRNGVAFQTTPLGALSDFAITNEGSYNGDWNPVWDVRTGRFPGGWTVEMMIPFKSLRYRPGPDQLWGIQLRRGIRRKSEYAYITPLPISAAGGAGGTAGIFRISGAATLVGIEVPDGSRNLEIKPYAIGRRTTDLNATPPILGDGDGDVGVDVKYGITRNLTADFTYNTDFAQVEVDEQQVNLTRFSLFFPEKREFFLEGRGIFDFARGGIGGGFGGALRSAGGGFFGDGNAPTLFYTRRIGLENGAIVPIVGGGRVTGKIGAFDVGALNIQTDAEEVSGAEMTNFTVVRVKRDVLRRSSVGALFTNRSVSLRGDGMSQAYGADATFSFFENVSFLGYLARTRIPGVDTEDQSYQGRFDYAGDLYGFQADHLLVERNFVPEVGFVRRDNFRRSFASGRFSPRPSSLDAVRQFRFEGSFDYILAADTGIVETRQSQLGFSAEFENSDTVGLSVADNYEFLLESFSPGPGVTLPVGGYGFRDVEATYTRGSQHALNGTVTARVGEYFNGDIRSIGFSRARVEISPQFTVEPSVSVNRIDTPTGSFRADLIVSRVTYTLTPRMFVSALAQYNSNSDAISNNFRLRWEYSPGSELFVVYSEDRNTNPLMPNRFSELRNRGFVVKVNRLFRL